MTESSASGGKSPEIFAARRSSVIEMYLTGEAKSGNVAG
jgi:hypothetical protein